MHWMLLTCASLQAAEPDDAFPSDEAFTRGRDLVYVCGEVIQYTYEEFTFIDWKGDPHGMLSRPIEVVESLVGHVESGFVDQRMDDQSVATGPCPGVHFAWLFSPVRFTAIHTKRADYLPFFDVFATDAVLAGAPQLQLHFVDGVVHDTLRRPVCPKEGGVLRLCGADEPPASPEDVVDHLREVFAGEEGPVLAGLPPEVVPPRPTIPPWEEEILRWHAEQAQGSP